MANTYTVLNGGELLAKITDGDTSTDLVNDAVANPAELSLEGVNGTRRLILDLTGFAAGGVESVVNVWVKLPEPVEIDAAGVASPKENEALPVALLSPRRSGSAYNTAEMAVAGNILVVSPGDVVAAPNGSTAEYACVSVVSDNPTGPVQLTLSLDFPHSFTR